MIFFDVETTGLISNESLPLSQQPRVIEIGALKTNDEGWETDHMSVLINPECPLPEIITKITGLTDADLVRAFRFHEVVGDLAEFFLGERKMLAHNARFDQMCLWFELKRIDRHASFPFCPKVIDTRTKWTGKLMNWAKEVKGADFVQTHRALDDCRVLRDCWFSEVSTPL